MKTETNYKITLNRKNKTYTIRRYDNGKLTAKYRSLPQGEDFSENWTENDIKTFLRYGDYYVLK
jgi:hypothetical protein